MLERWHRRFQYHLPSAPDAEVQQEFTNTRAASNAYIV